MIDFRDYYYLKGLKILYWNYSSKTEFTIKNIEPFKKSTKDVEMEDTPAAGAWPERENPNAARVAEIVDYVKQESDF